MKAIALMPVLLGLLWAVPAQNIPEKQRAHSFALTSMGKQKVRLDDYRGKVVLLNFWATWCAPCKAEMPEMVKWQAQYRTKGLQVIGITYPPYQLRAVRQFARRLKINYPVVFANKQLAKSYAVGKVLPVSIIIDRQGKVVDRILGFIAPEEFEQKVRPLLDQ
jgi:thiol-disulfide isomerase/thioredoxin